jgi:hypothetical protein
VVTSDLISGYDPIGEFVSQYDGVGVEIALIAFGTILGRPVAEITNRHVIGQDRLLVEDGGEPTSDGGQNVDRNRILNTEAESLVGSRAGLMISW